MDGSPLPFPISRSWAATIKALQKVILSALHALFKEEVDDPRQIIRDLLLGRVKKVFDPNDWRVPQNVPDGFSLVPLATRESQRNGPRDFLLDMERACRDQRSQKGNLTIKTHALVTTVLFEDGAPPRAIGVEARLGNTFFRPIRVFRQAHRTKPCSSAATAKSFSRAEP